MGGSLGLKGMREMPTNCPEAPLFWYVLSNWQVLLFFVGTNDECFDLESVGDKPN